MSEPCLSGTGGFRYGEALQKSIYFYETQQAGELPSWNRVPWRGDSVLDDGQDVGLDLSGGWFDAGDHVKFGYPMAASVTMLAWGAYDYQRAYEKAGQLDEMLNNLRFVNDYFIAAHPSPNEFYGQVGRGGPDHNWWGPPEVVDIATRGSRRSFKIDLNCPGTDLAAETAAAMAASAMVFQGHDNNYSAELLRHARELYDFAYATKGEDGKDNSYANCIADAASFYGTSFSLYWDELAWGAVWLWRATGEQKYRDFVDEFYPLMGFETQSTTPVYTWSQGWSDKAYGVYALMAALDPKQNYTVDVERWLDHWSEGEGRRSAGGVMVVDTWGVLRYAANTAFVAQYYSDRLDENNPRKAKYHQFAKRQIDYMLGDNPRSSSYLIGFGENFPVNPHHRGAHGSWYDSLNVPAKTRHILYGALVGGPTSDTNYEDTRDDYVANEVTTDYNAGFTSLAAAMFGVYGGAALPDSEFPPNEPPDPQWVVGTKRLNGSERHIGFRIVLQNRTSAPAKAKDDLYFRYFVDVSEIFAAGLTLNDIEIRHGGFTEATGISQQLQPWNPGQNIYYAEVSFDGETLYPGGQSEHRREAQFEIRLPEGYQWDNSNDPSWSDDYLTSDENWGFHAEHIPLYSATEGYLFGREPAK